ncbi:MAG: ribosome silencing factor [Candidatus Hatepunaea meridiana]|nr:ribosome silencing factor [Candidatus Hatepunaea meridiana]
MAVKQVKKLTVRTAARRAALFAAEKQAIDIIVLDLRKVTDFCDYFVIASGAVDVHVKAIYEYIEFELKKIGWRPNHIEGRENHRWVLMDYFDLIVHVLQPDARGYFSLETLWSDATRVKIKGLE